MSTLVQPESGYLDPTSKEYHDSLEAQPPDIVIAQPSTDQPMSVKATDVLPRDSTSTAGSSIMEPGASSQSTVAIPLAVGEAQLEILSPSPEPEESSVADSKFASHSMTTTEGFQPGATTSSVTESNRSHPSDARIIKKSLSNPVKDFFLSFRSNEVSTQAEPRHVRLDGIRDDAGAGAMVERSSKSVASLASHPDSHIEITKTELEEKDMEIEMLKAQNATISARLRKLEESSEASDREQVDMASSLVRLKVDNEELRDHEETLKSQVSQLKAAIDKAPEAAEAVVKEEMHRLMRRNEEVHNVNQELETQMAEMEKQLVNSKMQYAEVYFLRRSSIS